MKLPSTPMEFFSRLCVLASNEAIEFPSSNAMSMSRNSLSSSILQCKGKTQNDIGKTSK